MYSWSAAFPGRFRLKAGLQRGRPSSLHLKPEDPIFRFAKNPPLRQIRQILPGLPS